MSRSNIPWGDFTADSEVETWLQWVVKLVGENEWISRRKRIAQFWEERSNRNKFDYLTSHFHTPSDLAAWYLYLCEKYISDPVNYNILQGARVIPVVKAIVRGDDVVFKIRGVEDRIRDGFLNRPTQFDSTLFEILVASAYARRGWDVEFLPHSTARPKADLRAESSEGELFIECKRKSRISDYARAEREKWLRLFNPVRKVLISGRLPVFLDITFRVPLLGLKDDYLINRVAGILRLAVAGVVIDDDLLKVEVRPVDLRTVKMALLNRSLRLDSMLLLRLLFGYNQPWRGVTFAVSGQPRPNAPHVLDDIAWAAGAIWSCEAEDSINAKARYLKRDLAAAVRQLPENVPAAVHWAIEVNGDEQLALHVLIRTISSMYDFDTTQKDLRWVYCHLFEFEVPPDENWAVNETCHTFAKHPGSRSFYLDPPLLIARN